MAQIVTEFNPPVKNEEIKKYICRFDLPPEILKLIYEYNKNPFEEKNIIANMMTNLNKLMFSYIPVFPVKRSDVIILFTNLNRIRPIICKYRISIFETNDNIYMTKLT